MLRIWWGKIHKNLNKMRKGSDTRGKLKSTVYIDESLESLQHVYLIILILVQCPCGGLWPCQELEGIPTGGPSYEYNGTV
jgi:hypothetical protein